MWIILLKNLAPKFEFCIYFFLWFQHVETAQKLLHPGERPPMTGLCSHVDKKREVRKQVNHHLHMILTEFSYPLEDLEIYFSLYSTKDNNYVSEKITLAVNEELNANPKGMYLSLQHKLLLDNFWGFLFKRIWN